MSRIKMMLMAMVAVFAIGAVGASAAQASGSGTVDTNLGSCDILFTTTVTNPDAHAPTWAYGANLTAFSADPLGTCAASDFDANLHFHKNAGGDAQVMGQLEIDTPLGLCVYTGTIDGTWSWDGDYKVFAPDEDTEVDLDLAQSDIGCVFAGFSATVEDTSRLRMLWS